MLAMYPDYQQQAFEEIRQIFPNQSSDVLAEDIGKLQFVNRFIKESMRVNPTVPFVARCAKNFVKIGKYLLEIYSAYIMMKLKSRQVRHTQGFRTYSDHFQHATK